MERFREMKENTGIGKKRKEFLKSLEIGSRVFLNRFNEVGSIKSIDRAKRTVRVKVMDKVLNTSFDEISWVEIRDGWR